MRFAVVDVETTGGHPAANGITEIGIAVVEGDQVVDRFHSLVNPKQNIPLNIQALTGITPEMVADAPVFDEVANDVLSFLESSVFVAHNVNFDYAFVKEAFKGVGIKFEATKRLCTVQYTRAVLPGLPGYSLSKLCKKMNIQNENPHRALSDAEAAAQILLFVKNLDRKDLLSHRLKRRSSVASFPKYIDRKVVDALPNSEGIYYFHDKKGKVIYVGKATDIQKRVKSHFTSTSTSKFYQDLKREVRDITHKESGSDVIAALMEDHEIRHLWPRFNRAQKRNPVYYGVYAYRDRSDFWRIGINKVNNSYPPIKRFHTLHAARSWLLKTVEKYELKAEFCDLEFAVYGTDDIYLHNEHFEKMQREVESDGRSLIIPQKGRSKSEKGFIFVEKGEYKGIGFIDSDVSISSIDEIEQHLQVRKSSIITEQIIEKVLGQIPAHQLIELS
ncbi:exonuclease domain-containing protein [Salibacter sp.]|uniref:exonuclease domain-containing protein n=1 Tax=Salibacter sp. TaxID=2010995 RepID=UPI0028705B3C|nr:exonuclease domain-containing protein [Salibacter sp.]MDR9487074.1 exonuclease domain-containing protein [Salibacter sp.]